MFKTYYTIHTAYIFLYSWKCLDNLWHKLVCEHFLCIKQGGKLFHVPTPTPDECVYAAFNQEWSLFVLRKSPRPTPPPFDKQWKYSAHVEIIFWIMLITIMVVVVDPWWQNCPWIISIRYVLLKYFCWIDIAVKQIIKTYLSNVWHNTHDDEDDDDDDPKVHFWCKEVRFKPTRG